MEVGIAGPLEGKENTSEGGSAQDTLKILLSYSFLLVGFAGGCLKPLNHRRWFWPGGWRVEVEFERWVLMSLQTSEGL